MAKFHGGKTRDNSKAEIADGEGKNRFCFAQFAAFFQDNKERPYVALRWHDQRGQDLVDPTALLPRLKLRPPNQPRSYSVMPISYIHNGALMIESGAHYYAIMSPREQKEHEKLTKNLANNCWECVATQ